MAHEFVLIQHEEGTEFKVFLISIDQRLYHYDPRVQRLLFSDHLLTPALKPEGWRSIRDNLLTIVLDSFLKELGFQLKTMSSLNAIVYQLLRHLVWQDRDEYWR